MKNRKSKNASVELPAQPRRQSRRRILSTSAAAMLGVSLFVGSVGNVTAASNWTGATSAAWDTATNWANPAAVPLSTTDVTFPIGVTPNPPAGGSVVLTAPDVANTVSFNTGVGPGAPANPWTLAGGALTLTGGTASDITMNAAVTTTINSVLKNVGTNAITITSTVGTPQTAILALTSTGNAFGGVVNVNSGTVNVSGTSAGVMLGGTALNIGTVGAAGAGTAVVTETNTTSTTAGATTAVTVGNNGVWNLAANAESVGSIAGNGTAPSTAAINLVGGTALTTGALNTNTTYTGAINGVGATGTATSGSINKNGTGVWTVSGPGGTFGGLVTINTTSTAANAGAIALATASALGSASTAIVVNSGAAAGTGGTLQLTNAAGVSYNAYALTLNGAGSGATDQDGALVNKTGAGSNTVTGTLTLGSATTITNNAAATTLTISNATPIAGAFGLTLNTHTATGNGVLASPLGAVTSLTVNGAGSTWTLTGTNTAWTGHAINVNDSATLKAGAGSTNAFGIGSLITLPGAATLDLNGTSQVIGQLNATAATETVTNGATASGPATLTIGTAGVLPANATALTTGFVGVFTNAAGVPLNLVIAGNNAVAGSAATTFTIGGATANSYTGTTTVNTNNTLVVTNTSAATAASGALGSNSGTATDGVVVKTGASLQLGNGVVIGNKRLDITGAIPAATAGNGGAGGAGSLVVAPGATTSWAGPINLNGAVGTGTVFVAGAGSQITFTGGINKSNQTLVFNGTAGGTFIVNTVGISGGATGFNSDMVVNGGTTTFGVANSYAGPTWITNGGVLNANAVGALPSLVSDGGTAAARTTLEFDSAKTPTVLVASTGPSSLVIGSAGGTFNQAVQWIDNTGGVAGSTIALNTSQLTIGSTAPPAIPAGGVIANYSGAISGSGAAAIVKDGTNTQILSGANTYTGSTTVSGGVLQAGSSTVLVAGLPVSGPFGVNSATVVGNGGTAATLALNGNKVWIGTLNGNTNGIITNGSAATAAVLTIDSGAAAGTATFSGIIQNGGAATLGITKLGTNTQIIGSTAAATGNTYTGPTIVTSGKLQAGVATNAGNTSGAFGVNSTTTVGNVAGTAATLELAGFNNTIGSLTGNVNGIIQNNFGTAATLTIGSGAAAGTTTFAGLIRNSPLIGPIGAGALGITQVGASAAVIQVLSGANTYTGPTIVNGGTLQAGSSTALIGGVPVSGAFGVNSAVTVQTAGAGNAGATLDLAGTTNWIASLSDGGGLAAGAGTGIVTNSTGGAGTLFINTLAANATTSYGGVIKDTAGNALAVTIGGTGTQSLSNGGNTYTGGTNVLAGATLDIDASGTTLGAGVLTIAAPSLAGAQATIGTGMNAAGFATSTVGNAVMVNGSFSVSNVVLPVGTLGAPNTGTGAGTALVNGPYVPFGSNGFVSNGVGFSGIVTLAGAGVTTVTTNSGYLDFTGTIVGPGSGGLTLAGHTLTFIGGTAVSNTYAGLTTVGDAAGGPSGTNYVELGKIGGAVAIPGNLAITPNGYVQFTPGGGVTSNQIAPTASVLVNGTLDTAGLNQTINALTGTGTVRLDSSAFNSNIGGAPNAGGTLTVNSGLFTGVITGGNGKLTKVSVGTLILTGANTYTGNTNVNGGILQVDGSTTSANTFVALGATLQGIGTIGGNVINSGTVKPGDSPGTLTVTGNYTQNPSGNLRIELASTSSYGRLQVQGHAALNGTLTAVSVNGFTPKTGNVFTVLTAGQGVSGTFGTFNNQTAAATTGLERFSIVYDSNDVKLEFTQASFVQTLESVFGAHGLTPNEFAVAENLDRNLNNARLGKVISFLDNLPLGEVRGALDEIAPEEVASIYNTEVALANVQTSNLQRRTADLRAGSSGFSASGFHMAGSGPNYAGFLDGSAGPDGKDGKEMKENKQVLPEEQRVGVFLTGVGEWVSVGDDFNARGYDLTSGGFTLGVDYKVTSTFAIGLDAGYAHTNGDLNNGGRLDVDGGKLGLYATYFPGDFYIDAAVNGGLDSYSIKRAGLGGTTFGDTDGGDLNALFGAGYMFHTGGLSIGPTGSFQYTYMGLKHFTEHGSVAPLDFPGQNEDSIRTAVGGKASYDWKTGGIIIRPEVSVAWQHEFADTAYAVDSQFANADSGLFRVNGPNIGRDSVLVGAGAAILWNERFSTYVYYDGEFGRTNYNDSNVSGGLRLAF